MDLAIQMGAYVMPKDKEFYWVENFNPDAAVSMLEFVNGDELPVV